MRKFNKNNYIVDKANNKFIYSGPCYSVINSSNDLKKIKIIMSLICIINIIFIAIIGFNKSAISNNIFFTLPFVIQLFPVVYLISALYYVFIFKDKLTKEQFNKSYNQYKNSLKVLMLFNALVLIGLIYISILNKNINMIKFEFLLEFLMIILNLFSFNNVKKLNFTVEDGKIVDKL